jgi:hypothetical protein
MSSGCVLILQLQPLWVEERIFVFWWREHCMVTFFPWLVLRIALYAFCTGTALLVRNTGPGARQGRWRTKGIDPWWACWVLIATADCWKAMGSAAAAACHQQVFARAAV